MYKSIVVEADKNGAAVFNALPEEVKVYLNNPIAYLDGVAALLETEVAKPQVELSIPLLWWTKAHMFAKVCRLREFSQEELEGGSLPSLLMYYVYIETLLHFLGLRTVSILGWLDIVNRHRELGQEVFNSIKEDDEEIFKLGKAGPIILFLGIYILMCDRAAFEKWCETVFDGRVVSVKDMDALYEFGDLVMSEEAKGSFMLEELKVHGECVDDLLIVLLRGVSVNLEFDTELDFESNPD